MTFSLRSLALVCLCVAAISQLFLGCFRSARAGDQFGEQQRLVAAIKSAASGDGGIISGGRRKFVAAAAEPDRKRRMQFVAVCFHGGGHTQRKLHPPALMKLSSGRMKVSSKLSPLCDSSCSYRHKTKRRSVVRSKSWLQLTGRVMQISRLASSAQRTRQMRAHSALCFA